MRRRPIDPWDRTAGGLYVPGRPSLPTRRYLQRMGAAKDCCNVTPPPGCWAVAFSGIANDTCTYCSGYNKTWYVRPANPMVSPYTWTCDLVAACVACGAMSLTLVISDDTITVSLGGATWTKSITSASAAFLTSHTLSFASGSNGCDCTGSSCTITPGYDANGNCPCPYGCATYPCNEPYLFFTGTTPPRIAVSIGDVGDNSCSLCDAYANTTYVLSDAGNCKWALLGVNNSAGCGGVLGSPLLGMEASVGAYSNPPHCSVGDAEWEFHTAVYRGSWTGLYVYPLVKYYGCTPDLPVDGTAVSVTLHKYNDGSGYCDFPDTITLFAP